MKELFTRLTQQPDTNAHLWLFWSYLLLIVIAEILTAFVNPYPGQVTHILVLVVLVFHGGLETNLARRRLALALAVLPLIRILSLSLPIAPFPQIAAYAIVGTPLLIATWIIIRHLGLSQYGLGLRSSNPLPQLMLAGGGLGLGAIEYAILQPAPLFDSFSWQTFWLSALILAIFTGFAEELIFRGLLQSAAMRVLRYWGIIYVALLFAALHIGHRSAVDIFFVLGVGLLFAYIVHRSGSILGVTLAHSLTNITLFLIMPYYTQPPLNAMADTISRIIWGGTGLALIALIFLVAFPSRVAAHTPARRAPRSARRRRSGTVSSRSGEKAGVTPQSINRHQQRLRSLRPEPATNPQNLNRRNTPLPKQPWEDQVE